MTFTLHTAISSSYDDFLDFSPLEDGYVVNPAKVFPLNSSDIAIGMTKKQMKDSIAAKLAWYESMDPGYSSTNRIAMWDGESFVNANVSAASCVDAIQALTEECPNFDCGSYHLPWVNMYVSEPDPATMTINSTYSTVIVNSPVQLPDIYWVIATRTNLDGIMDAALVEIERALDDAFGPGVSHEDRIVPVICTVRPNPTWTQVTPLEPQTFVAMTNKLTSLGINECIIWNWAPTMVEVGMFNRWALDVQAYINDGYVPGPQRSILLPGPFRFNAD